jgi:nicotinic acid mononucleotide adenylyltransferase
VLKLIFYTKEKRLKVREAFTGEIFPKVYQWEEIEFSVSDNGDFTMLWTSLLPDLPPKYAESLLRLVSARFPLDKDHHKLHITCPDLTFDGRDSEWVFYGGSFHPWHSGHQACLDLLPDDKTCYILPDRNPQKEIIKDNPVPKILEISSKAKLKAKQFIVPTFLLEEKKNPTVEWIEKLSLEYPEKKLSLLLGFDSLSQIQGWIRSHDLLDKLDTIYYVARLESEEEREKILAVLRDNYPHLGLVFLGRHEHEHVSSTNLRNKKGRP